MIEAVIFDMDGVISDTLPLHSEAESRVLLKHGIKMSPQQILQEFNAMPDKKMFKTIFNRFERPLNLPQVEDEKWDSFQQLAKGGIPTIPGSIEFIESLSRNGYILGLASSAPLRIINLVVNTLKIRDRFATIVCTDEIEHGKPAPDIFLLAAKKLVMNPKDCLVIEDAIRGVQAAKAAGMKCIAITTTETRAKLKGADKIVNNFSEINLEEIKNL